MGPAEDHKPALTCGELTPSSFVREAINYFRLAGRERLQPGLAYWERCAHLSLEHDRVFRIIFVDAKGVSPGL